MFGMPIHKKQKGQCSLNIILLKLYFRRQGKLRRIDIPHIERHENRTEHNDPSKYDNLLWVEDLFNLVLKKITHKKPGEFRKTSHRVVKSRFVLSLISC